MGIQMSFEVQIWISAAILYAAALGLFMAARVERRAARYDRQQADDDFATVQKALVLFNCGAKEEAMSTITRLGMRPDRPRTGTTAKEFIASASKRSRPI
jgi:hypothetical protein